MPDLGPTGLHELLIFSGHLEDDTVKKQTSKAGYSRDP